MVRLLDVGRALASRGYAAEGELTIACEEDPPFAIRVSPGGAAQVVEARRAADVELSRASLASIAVAGMRPSEASDLGLLRGNSAALATMEKIFSGPRFLCLDPF
jgi:predicted acetyltransferase